VTNPGVPTSPGFPVLDPVAQQAIRMAQSRLEALTHGNLPLPAKKLTEDEKAEALKSAKDDACYLCGALHAAPNTPACPRVATFKLNGDGKLVEGSFWPDAATDSSVEMSRDGQVIGVHHQVRGGWDTSRVVFISDVADDGEAESEVANGVHPG
jgi:hypothetical protein